MKTRILLIPYVVLLFAAAETRAQSDQLSGQWLGEVVRTESNRTRITFELKFDGTSAVSGTLVGLPQPGEISAGTFDPKTGILRLEVTSTANAAVRLVFEGTVVAATATGKVTRDGGNQGSFVIAKAK